MRSFFTYIIPAVAFVASVAVQAAPAVDSVAAPAPAATPAPAAATSTATPAPAAPAAANAMVIPEAPYGTCPIDMQQKADTEAVKYMHLGAQGKATLKGVYGECAQLEALRASSSMISFLSSYVTLIEQEGNTVNFNRAATILTLSSSIGITSAFSSAATQSLKSGFGTRPPSYHGILKQTPDFLIVGSEQRHIVKERELGVAVVSLITVIKGKIVTVNFFGGMSDSSIFGKLAGRAEAYGSSLIAANP